MNQFRTPPIVKGLLIINIVVFGLQSLLPNGMGDVITEYLGLHYFGSPLFYVYQFFTHIFLHGSFMHLFSNMFALWMFGRLLEYEIGSRRFLIYYTICGIGAAILHSGIVALEISAIQDNVSAFLANPTPELFDALVIDNFKGAVVHEDFLNNWYDMPQNAEYIKSAMYAANKLLSTSINTVTLGASGAIFGILLAFGMMHPNDRIMLLIPPIPMKAKYFVMGYALLELYLGLSDSTSNIAHFAHLGGMIFGFFILRYWKRTGRIYY
ncbi:MAG: rhomboid family intramembrane serine protease [Rikenellaceae bacterium]